MDEGVKHLAPGEALQLPGKEDTRADFLEAVNESFDLREETPFSHSSLALAYIGDAVFELAVRTVIVRTMNGRTKDMNRMAVRAVSAKAQSEMMNIIEPLLTEEEAAVYRRGRNAHSPTMAKHATVAEYRRATGLEALCGYLYLRGENRRLMELIRSAYGRQE